MSKTAHTVLFFYQRLIVAQILRLHPPIYRPSVAVERVFVEAWFIAQVVVLALLVSLPFLL